MWRWAVGRPSHLPFSLLSPSLPKPTTVRRRSATPSPAAPTMSVTRTPSTSRLRARPPNSLPLPSFWSLCFSSLTSSIAQSRPDTARPMISNSLPWCAARRILLKSGLSYSVTIASTQRWPSFRISGFLSSASSFLHRSSLCLCRLLPPLLPRRHHHHQHQPPAPPPLDRLRVGVLLLVLDRLTQRPLQPRL